MALEKKYQGKIDFIIADVNDPQGQDLASEFGVTSIPAIFVLDSKGQHVYEGIGFTAQSLLETPIEKAIAG